MFLNTGIYLSGFLNCQTNTWHGFGQAAWCSIEQLACRVGSQQQAGTMPCKQCGCGPRMGFSGTGMVCSVSADPHSRNFLQTYYTATDTTLGISRHSNKDRVLQTVKLLHSSPPFQKQEDCATVKGVVVLERLPERRQISSWGVKALLWETRDFLYVWGSALGYFKKKNVWKHHTADLSESESSSKDLTTWWERKHSSSFSWMCEPWTEAADEAKLKEWQQTQSRLWNPKSGCCKDRAWAWHRQSGAGENPDLERKGEQTNFNATDGRWQPGYIKFLIEILRTGSGGTGLKTNSSESIWCWNTKKGWQLKPHL